MLASGRNPVAAAFLLYSRPESFPRGGNFLFATNCFARPGDFAARACASAVLVNNLINQTVIFGLFGGHNKVSFHVVLDLIQRMAAVVS